MHVQVLIGDLTNPETEQAVWGVLCECNGEYVPPLGLRESTSTRKLAPEADAALPKPYSYFETMKAQTNLCAYNGGKLIGFCSFRAHVSNSAIELYAPCNYVSTTCVTPAMRQMGIATKLYQFLLYQLPTELKCEYTATRTWTTNLAHLALLKKMHFNQVSNLPNDRGEGIHTQYFVHENH